MPSELPPSYLSVVYELNKLIGFDPSKSQTNELAADTEKFRPWMATLGLTSTDPAEDLKGGADKALAAYKAIKAMFDNLRPTLASFDDKRMPPTAGYFVPRLDDIHRAFDQHILGSKQLAGNISTYGRKFDEKIIPMCNDKSLTVEERKNKLETFIKDAATLDTDSKATRDEFSTLEKNFEIFTQSFKGWAVVMDATFRPQYEKLKKQLEDGSAPNPHALETYLHAIEVEFDNHDRMRSDLDKLGQTNLKDFTVNGDLMAAFWQGAHNDTLRVQEWLKGGAKDADMPEYMRKSVDQAIHVYSKMADYLDHYAAGL